MTLHPLVGHEAAREAVAGAHLRGRLPQVLLLHGPRGVGKQRFALWMGALLLCDAPTLAGPCGACQGCRLAGRVEHPDLHWYFPVVKPPSRGSRERDDEALEEARRARLTELRADSLVASHSEDPRGLHLGTVRNLRRSARTRPAMAPRQVYLVAEAEELVAQDASPEAANALLKVLEEPPEGTSFLLTSSEPGRLLPTIRSRASSLFLSPLPVERVAEFLEEHRGVTPDEARTASALASGSIGRALGFLGDDDADGPLEALRKEAFHLLRAGLSDRPSDRFARALDYRPSGGRGHHELLVALELWLRDLGAAAAGSPEAILNRDGTDWLSRIAREREIEPVAVAQAVEAVEETRAQAAGNVNPQLFFAVLLLRLNQILLPQRAEPASAR
jgi:DNA polymerase III subunit delta'